MFPLDAITPAARGQHTAGRFGVDVVFLLAPLSEAGRAAVAVVPLAALARSSAIASLAAGEDARVSRVRLRDHAVVLRVQGAFLSTDRVALARIDADGDSWSMVVTITHVETPNSEPAPRDLYVVLALDAADRPPARITLRFDGRERDVSGAERPLADPVAPSRVVEIA